ncbi:MAG: PQQ-dependent sugar dehydrogenase [Chitinophagaceae bacterium]
MKKPPLFLLLGLLFCVPSLGQVVSSRMKEVFLKTDLVNAADNFQDPWEITYGPDDSLWVTEAKGYKVNKVHPVNGGWRTILDLSNGSSFTPSSYRRTFGSGQNPWPQGGMMGLAIHPEFITNPARRFVYIAYVRSYIGQNQTYNSELVQGHLFMTWVVRFTYNPLSGMLGSPVKVCDTIRGSNDHNSGRLIIKPEGGIDYLYYAVGDMGAGQFDNISRTIKSQLTSSYEGKILRFNLEEDGDPVQEPTTMNYDRWIPNDNPYNVFLGEQSAVWSKGMRNNQGFAYDTINGVPRFYGTSHGPFSDDEVNLLEPGKNYGHPLVIGYKNDGNYNNAKAGPSGSSLPLIISEASNAATIGTSYMDPIYSNYPAAAGNNSTPWSIQYIYNNRLYWDGSNNLQAQNANQYWHSEGYSGMGIYAKSFIPGWKNSLLIESLKWGRVLRLKLSSDGAATVPVDGADTVGYFGSRNRFRDVAVDPGGRSIYVVMDRSSSSSGPSANNPIVPACAGCVQKYTFLGYLNDASNKSSIPEAIDVTDAAPGACVTGSAVRISSADQNTNLWVPFTGPDGNVLAEVYANGNNLGVVQSSFFIHNGAIRVAGGKKYLHRSITITPENQPAAGQPVRIRLYISKAEFDELDADGASGISGLTDLRILKNDDNCGPAIISTTSVITPTHWNTHGADGYVLQYNALTGFSSFYFGAAGIVLPVRLLSFTVMLQANGSGLLQWERRADDQSAEFLVERSIDGKNFITVGKRSGDENSSSKYSYIDNSLTSVFAPVVYYRLRAMDKDGSISYSNVIPVSLSFVASAISLSPNPTTGEAKLILQSRNNSRIQWKLCDNTGRVILQASENLVKGQNIIPINLSSLTPGIYYVQVSGEGVDATLKVQRL